MYSWSFGLELSWFQSIVNCLGEKGKSSQYCRSLFRMMSIVGYCTFPLAVFGFIVSVIPHGHVLPLKIIMIIISLLWSTTSCAIVLRDLVNEGKITLCIYPVILFYTFLAWYSIIAWLQSNDQQYPIFYIKLRLNKNMQSNNWYIISLIKWYRMFSW